MRHQHKRPPTKLQKVSSLSKGKSDRRIIGKTKGYRSAKA